MPGKVAIILPVYNVSDYLPHCLNSLFLQTYENFDIFAINDASTDNSLQILLQYQKKDSRLSVISHQVNQGISATRNAALEIIEKQNSYDYIYFCDSDDFISPKALEILVHTLIKEEADVATCCYNRFGCNKETTHAFNNYCSFGPESFIEQIFSLGKWKKKRGAGGQVFLRLFDATKIKGIRFWTEAKVAEDELFCAEVATRITKVSYIPEPLYFYRDRPTSLSHSKTFSEKALTSRIQCLKFTKKISYYALIINACAILKQIRKGCYDLAPELSAYLSPLLRLGRSLKLISFKEYLLFSLLKSLNKKKTTSIRDFLNI